MSIAGLSLKEDYWETFSIRDVDIEFLYSYLLEIETPLTPLELVGELVKNRIQDERSQAEEMRTAGGNSYLPKEAYSVGDSVLFPAMGGERGSVVAVRDAKSYGDQSFKVIQVEFEDGKSREFAAELEAHQLNDPIEIDDSDPLLNAEVVLEQYGELLSQAMTETLEENDDFVYIAGRWFPQALLVDVNLGNLNLAEAVLDMAGGGPLPTTEIMSQVDLPEGINTKLAEFSLDLALQEDNRFDEVGSTGKVAWFLHRLEPSDVLETPVYLRYSPQDYDNDLLDEQMLALEARLDDELSNIVEDGENKDVSKRAVSLIFPHWRVGSLPLTPKLAKLFPSAYESPRVQFTLVDGNTGDQFPGWVVRMERYVYGLRDWYIDNGVMPGSIINLKRGEKPGEVIVSTEAHRSNKEWVRTALVGADGGVVYATLKQAVSTTFDDWMAINMPSEVEALDAAWKQRAETPMPFEKVVVDTLKNLAKLNPQQHVHAAELYSAVNVIYRCPPGPIMALLMSRPWFVHVGDLHFRYNEDGE